LDIDTEEKEKDRGNLNYLLKNIITIIKNIILIKDLKKSNKNNNYDLKDYEDYDEDFDKDHIYYGRFYN
jgi:hypothetical protein